MIYKNNRNHFTIYYSDNLFKNWKEHDIINYKYNNLTNEHLTRGAGNIFRINDKIIRPAQYSNRGINGEAVILYEIKNLTKSSYQEVPFDIISREYLKNTRANHTFSLCDQLITIDSRLERQTDHPYSKINIEKELVEMQNNNYYLNHKKLEEAFSLNTSGNGKCYYGANLGGVTYIGERDWDVRWNLVKDCINFNNKNVIEIGCNMGIFINYLKKFRNINKAVGVDQPDDLLIKTNKKDTIKAAKLLTQGLCLQENDINYVQIDLNKENYENSLGTDFDIAIAMSIYKWIDDKDRFLTYLSNFKTVLYEGHDSDDVEIERFKQKGFDYKILGKTQTGLSYSSDSTRTLILFIK
jgi:SAM-dependent methyltransferase